MNLYYLVVTIVLYLSIIAYLGYRGFSQTKNSADYMLGGRENPPLCYGHVLRSHFYIHLRHSGIRRSCLPFRPQPALACGLQCGSRCFNCFYFLRQTHTENGAEPECPHFSRVAGAPPELPFYSEVYGPDYLCIHAPSMRRPS